MQRNRFLLLIAVALATLLPSVGLRAGTALYNPTFQGAAQSDIDLGGHTLKNVGPGGSIPKAALGCGAGTTFLFEGDSITAGANLATPATQRYSALFMQQMFFATAAGTGRNDAVSGSKIADIVSRYAANVAPHRPTANGGDGGPKAYLVVMIGTNDLSASATAASMIAALAAYTTQARTDGFTVVLSTVLPSTHIQPGGAAMNLAYDAFNNAIRTGQIPCDAVWDAAAALGLASDAATFPDGLHPSAAGHLALAQSLNSQLLSGGWNLGIQPRTVLANQNFLSSPGTPFASFSVAYGTGYSDGLDITIQGTNAQPTAAVPWISSDLSNLSLNSASSGAAVKFQDVTGGPAVFGGPVTAPSFTGAGTGLTGIPLAALVSGSATSGQILTWNGSAWSPATSSGTSTAIPLTSLLSGSATSGQVLTWNGTAWSPANSSAGGTGFMSASGGTFTGPITFPQYSKITNGGDSTLTFFSSSTEPSGPCLGAYSSNVYLDAAGGTGSTIYIGNIHSGSVLQTGTSREAFDGPGSFNSNVLDGTPVLYTTYSGNRMFDFIQTPSNASSPNGNAWFWTQGNDIAINSRAGHILYLQDVTGGAIVLGGTTTLAAGKALAVTSGTNALAGTVTLSSGTATITSTAIDANTVIALSLKTASGTPGTFTPRTSVAAGSATVTGASTDNGTYNWIAFKVN